MNTETIDPVASLASEVVELVSLEAIEARDATLQVMSRHRMDYSNGGEIIVQMAKKVLHLFQQQQSVVA